VEIDKSGWSGDGAFTAALVAALASIPDVEAIRVEDSPASRGETGYLFLSNEIYVKFTERQRTVRARVLGLIPTLKRVREPSLDLEALDARLAGIEGIGPADYSDPAMLQYLRAERIVPPYQTRGYKLVEMVRIYCVGTALERSPGMDRQP
jgi:hypothetical protein